MAGFGGTADGAVLKEQRDLVLAEGALKGERVVAIVRLAMFLALGVATTVIPAPYAIDLGDAPLRRAVLVGYGAYAVFSVAFFFAIKNPNPRAAFNAPFLWVLIDMLFVMSMDAISASVGVALRPELPTAVLSLLICFSVARFSHAHVVFSVLMAIATVVEISLNRGSFTGGWLPFATACFLSLGGIVWWSNNQFGRMFTDLRRRENLSRFLPQQNVERLLRSNGMSLAPVQREVTILFSDIRDFTTLSETLPPTEVLAFLDAYFSRMAHVIKARDGMVNKYLGDGMLAVFGAPEVQDDHAARAVAAAVDMRSSLQGLNAERARKGQPPLRIGIGLHTGVVAAGMLGGADAHEYTVIGDAVNLASRIEGLTKGFERDILASERTWELGGREFNGERLGEEKVKGRAAPVVVYAVTGAKGASPAR